MYDQLNNMIVLVLSGGQSSRMGQDKGLIQEQGMSWIEKLQQKLAYLEIPVYVSVSVRQRSAYQKQFSAQQLITDKSLKAVNGPLKGILSAHLAHPDHHILCLPCDMTLLDARVFDLWLDRFDQYYPQHHVFVSKTPDGLQPICGIYSREGLLTLYQYYQEGALKNQSMHGIVEEMLNSYIIDVPEPLIPLFKNFNTPEELE